MPARPPQTEHVRAKCAAFHPSVVESVATAIQEHAVVVVGMAVNPHCKRARRALDAAGVPHHYLELGGYHNMWRPRLALKMWSGWPTFPQVFVHGTLIGGADQTQHMLRSGELQAILERGEAA